MSLAIATSKLRGLVGAAAALGLLAGLETSEAQTPAATSWIETLSTIVDETFDGQAGVDELAPEDLSHRLAGSSWELEGDVEFGSSGPPSVTVSMRGDLQSGVNTLFGGTSYAYIAFEFQVRQIATPPVSVSSVPMTVHSRGSAAATGNPDLPASAFVFLSLSSAFQGPLADFEAGASNDPQDQPSDSYDMTKSFSVPPGTIVSGDMAASAVVDAVVIVLGTSASATAFVDPVIQVADELIPGTAVSYRDYFDIEFGEGYMIGDPSPVDRKTWSELKALYGDGRVTR